MNMKSQMLALLGVLNLLSASAAIAGACPNLAGHYSGAHVEDMTLHQVFTATSDPTKYIIKSWVEPGDSESNGTREELAGKCEDGKLLVGKNRSLDHRTGYQDIDFIRQTNTYSLNAKKNLVVEKNWQVDDREPESSVQIFNRL